MYSTIVKLVLLSTAFVIHQCSGFSTMPSYVKACSQSDPKFKECAIKNGREAIPFIIAGDATYHVPNFKPFRLEYASLEASENIKLYVNDAELWGFETAELQDIDWNFANQTVTLQVFVSKLINLGTYNMNGRILVMTLKGSGPMNVTQYDTTYSAKCHYSLKTRNNKQYAHLEKVDLTEQISKLHMYFGNLLNNTQISDQMNLFLNENWEILVEELYPSVNLILAQVIMSIINPLAAKIPLDNILLP